MNTSSTRFKNVDEYIEASSNEVQDILSKIRSIVKRVAPNVIEEISYGMPAYKLNKKPLVYYAAFKNHIGVYATPSAHAEFTDRLAEYKQGKGSVQFPLDQPIPYELIEQMISYNADLLR